MLIVGPGGCSLPGEHQGGGADRLEVVVLRVVEMEFLDDRECIGRPAEADEVVGERYAVRIVVGQCQRTVQQLACHPIVAVEMGRDVGRKRKGADAVW